MRVGGAFDREDFIWSQGHSCHGTIINFGTKKFDVNAYIYDLGVGERNHAVRVRKVEIHPLLSIKMGFPIRIVIKF